MRCAKREILFSKITLFFLIAFVAIGNAQNLPIGGWRMHLPYKNCRFVTGSNSSIWSATDEGLFHLNKTDLALERITKIEGLSDLAIRAIAYNPYNDILFVGYQTGNIDLIHGNEIINLPDIKHANIIGNKCIQNVYFVGKLAYVSTGFGIVVVDTDRKEVKDTYLIGPNGTYLSILDIVSDATRIFAATENGIYYAPINSPYLSNFSTWTKFSDILTNYTNSIYDAMIIFNGKLIVTRAATFPCLAYQQDMVFDMDLTTDIWDTTLFDAVAQFSDNANNIHDYYVYNNKLYMVDLYSTFEVSSSYLLINNSYPANLQPLGLPSPQQVYVDQTGMWVADLAHGLIKQNNAYNGTPYYPNGPVSTDAYAMTEVNDQLLVVPGGHDDAWNNVLNRKGLSTLTNGWWTNYDKYAIPQIDTLFDILSAAIDPKDANHYYLGSYGWGLFEVKNGVFDTLWDNHNSTLQRRAEYQWCGISGMQFDTSGNLWVVNANVTTCLNVFKADRTWQAFDFSSLIPIGTNMSSVMITSTGQKWMIVPRGGGMLVFDDNGTLSNTGDDRKKRLGFTAGIGNIPGTEVSAMAEDQNGEIWIGTDKGIGVFYCADNIFNTNGCDAQQILITQDTYVQILLETQVVTAIAIDGANRKWIGTESGGVFLMSSDGQKELQHFTAANSPLLSDDVTSIEIDKATGEVFFGTTKGIVSYMGEANEGKETMGEVYAYPNPVAHEYLGPIAITGLVKNADIKITDIRGQVVFKTTALGGRAIWDGNNFQGVRAATGVYIVFISNADGTEKAVTKILLIN